MLLIGDPIPIGYHDSVCEQLRGVATVHRPAVNCSSTRIGLANLRVWLGEHGINEPWDLIQFNHGLHGVVLPRPMHSLLLVSSCCST